jgi:hypothetical protein
MRNLLAATILLATCVGAVAEETTDEGTATDLSPLACAWGQLSTDEQTQIRESFKTEDTGGDILLHYPTAPVELARRAATACNLNYTETQINQLAAALGAKGAEELARWGIGKRGAIEAALVDKTVASIHEGKRVRIGDALSCGENHISREWDNSVVRAMTRAGIRSVDGRSIALLSLTMFSIYNQEGHMRRINGETSACT